MQEESSLNPSYEYTEFPDSEDVTDEASLKYVTDKLSEEHEQLKKKNDNHKGKKEPGEFISSLKELSEKPFSELSETEFLELQNRYAEIESSDKILDTEAFKILKGLKKYITDQLCIIKPDDYDFSEAGTAEFIIDLIIGRFLYIEKLGGEYFYNSDSGTWQPINLVPALIIIIADILNSLPIPKSVNEYKQRCKHCAHLLTATGVRAVHYFTIHDAKIIETPDIFDKNLYIVIFSNGVYELETGIFREHSPADYSTMSTDQEYDPKAKCPLFEKVISEALQNDKENIKFLQKYFGYSLSGSTQEQCCLFAVGNGDNCKTTIFSAHQNALSNYAKSLPITSLLLEKNRSSTNDLAGLRAIRYLVAGEAEKGKRLDESLLKILTGQDIISARFLYKEFFDFIPNFKLVIHTNHLPVITGVDVAIWRRIRVLPFLWRIPADKKDKMLPEKLKAEAAGILQWAIEGYKLYKTEGLEMTNTMEEAKKDYQKSCDILSDFINDWCILDDPQSETFTLNLYQHFEKYVEETGSYKMSMKKFSQSLVERGFTKQRDEFGVFFIGIKPDPKKSEAKDDIPF